MTHVTAPDSDGPSAIFLSEYLLDINTGAGFLNTLSATDQKKIHAAGTRCKVSKGEGLFFQGDPHTGVWIVESGRVRTFYAGPSGREITLAYWSVGHFVGGPEVFGIGRHVWSADVLQDCDLLFLSGTNLQKLVREVPDFAVAVINGLVNKGKCYSALIQMLGTRTVSERLRQLLVILAETYGRHEKNCTVIDRTITYDQIATIVGATRQWVTQSLDRLQAEGVLEITRKEIKIADIKQLFE
ncbi:MAG: Crp/Fnr family transcriptional regulator [Pseudomonadota bacterium]